MSQKKNGIGCAAGRVNIVDPNDFYGFDSSDNIPVALEDLNISVKLTSYKKGRTVLTKEGDNSKATANTTGTIAVNFIEGSVIGNDGKRHLTTKYTDLVTIETDAENDETLGITSIDIEFNSSYAPLITINFIDVRGSSIFQNEYRIKNSESKYTTFFQLPYPLFELEIKGFYGLPVKYCLHMYKFNSKFNSKTGNFEITANFVGYTYAMLSDMLLGYLKAVGETTLGKERYDIYNEGKSVPVPTLNELSEKIGNINPGLDNVNKEEGGDYQAANESIGILDDISGEIDSLGSSIDKDASTKTVFDFIVLKKDDITKDFVKNKIEEEYQKTVYNKDDEESLVLQYNEKSPNDVIVTANWVFKYDTTGNGNRVYKNLSLKKLENATDTELKSYFGNYTTNNETLNDLKDCLSKYHTSLSDTEAFDVIDMRLLKQILKYKKDNAIKRKDTEKSALADSYKNEVISKLGFDPTSRPIIECFTAAIEVLSECIFIVATNTANHTERTNQLKKAFKIEGSGSKNSDIKNKALQSDDYLPWPAYQEYDVDKKAYLEKFLGSSSLIDSPNDIDEVAFIEELHAGFRASQLKEEQNNLDAENSQISSWFAVNPMDLKEYSENKPYTRFKPKTADDVITVLLIRAMTLLGYTNDYNVLSDEEIKALAKIEAEAIIRDIEDTEDKKIKRGLTQKTTKEILNNQSSVNGSVRRVLTDDGSNYLYSYIFNKTYLRVLPINQGFIEEGWGDPNDKNIDNVLKGKANDGFVFLTNYSSSSNLANSFYKADDGGVYLKIIDPSDISAGQLPSELVGENKLILEGLKKDKITNSTDAQACGFNSLSSEYGIQEFVNLDWGVNYVPAEDSFKWIFYRDTRAPNVDKINHTWRGLGYTKKATYKRITGKEGSTYSEDTYIGKLNEKIAEIGATPAHYTNTSANQNNLHDTVGANIYFLAAQNTEDITYPYICYGNRGFSISLFGSKFYHQLAKSKITVNGKVVTYCPKQARAMAFLHTLPFNVEDDNPFGAPEILNTFRYKGGIIHAPRLWCAYVGSVLWRNSRRPPVIDKTTKEIIGGGSGDEDPISWGEFAFSVGKVLFNGTYYNRTEYFPFYMGSAPQRDIEADHIINRLPIQVIDEFIKSFLDFVNGDGPTDWNGLKKELEIFDTANKTSDDFDKFLDFIGTEPTYNQIFKYSGVKEDVIQKNYYLFNSYGNSIWLELKDSCDATDNIIKALKEEVIILNNNYKIWSGGGGGTTDRSLIRVKMPILKTYLDEVTSVFKSNEDSFNKAKEDKRLDNTIFGTSNKDEIKLGLYRTCKNIYDKWLAGANSVDNLMFQCGGRSNVDANLAKKYNNNKTRLIDSFRFVSRAFSDIGDLLYIDPTPIKEWLGNNTNMSSYEAITSTLASNNFEFIALPNFINFNDKENLESIFRPYDYFADSSKLGSCGPSFVCVYAGQSSQHLDYYDNEYEDDGFDLRCDRNGNVDPTIPEDFTSEVNADYEEPIGAFVVKYSQQNQNVFKDITLDQSEFTETDESLQIQDDIAQKGRENSKSYMGQNIYNVYAVRSYTAEVEMMGNAMIQPMMYFQLDNIPMFHGAYMITSVNHSLTPNTMKTKFKGVRIKYTKTPLVTSKEVYENIIENSDMSNSDSSSSGGSGGSGGKAASGTYEPIVATLIENGVRNGYIDEGKKYGSVTTKKVTGGSKKYFNITASSGFLIAEAAVAFDKMFDDFGDWMLANGFKKNAQGKLGHISSLYRSYQTQANMKSSIKAKAGKSYHGWGLAVDWFWNNKKGEIAAPFNGSGTPKKYFGFDINPAMKWLYDNSYKYGIINPGWAKDGVGYDEAWHWEYHGTSAICLVKANPNVVGGYKIPVSDSDTYYSFVKNPKKSDGSENVFSKTSCKGVYVKGDGTDGESGPIKGAVEATADETLNFFKKLLKKLSAPETEGNLIWLKAWRQAEGGKATWNPLNSTQPINNSTNYNDNGVKNYMSEADGLEATYKTITNGAYPNIVKELKNGIQNKQAALDLAIKLQKQGNDLCIWVRGPKGCQEKGGIPKSQYLANILSYAKVSGSNIWKTKSGSNKNENSTPKKANDNSEKKGIIIYGGIGKYGASWIKEQWTAAGLATNIVNYKIIFEEYNGRTVQKIKSDNPDYDFIGLFGFSGGGPKVWPYTLSNEFEFIGLIDPSTSATDLTNYAGKAWGDNVRIMLNPTAWSGQYKAIGDRLAKIKAGKTDKNSDYYQNRDYIFPVNDKHTDIPLKFFTKFKDEIDDL